MTPEAFEERLANKDGDFSNVTFPFVINLSQNFDFALDFSHATFLEDVSFANSAFIEEVSFKHAEFKQDLDFSLADFFKRVHFDDIDCYGTTTFRRTSFTKMVHFKGAYFYGDVFFERTFFARESLFIKTHFLRDVYFHKTFFGMRADFSYAAFADLYVSSFFSIRSSYEKMDGTTTEDIPPRLIFRYVFFPKKTMFTNVDLSRVIFQDSMIEQIIFKDCKFSQIEGRNCFYSEIAKEVEFMSNPDRFERIKSGQMSLDFRLNDGRRRGLNIGDVITFVNKEKSNQKFKTFIIERHVGKDWDELFETMSIVHPYRDFNEEREFLGDQYHSERVSKSGVVAYGFKKFDDQKHWENLEDVNRQMKKSLEDSKDWQKAGDFYRGEMIAMINSMKEKKEKPVYRTALALYGIFSGFCESVGRIFVFMMISFAISILILNQFKPEFSFVEILQYSFGFFIPLLGKESISLRSLELLPWQNIVIMIEIVWYYLLWFFLALTLQRKFKR